MGYCPICHTYWEVGETCPNIDMHERLINIKLLAEQINKKKTEVGSKNKDLNGREYEIIKINKCDCGSEDFKLVCVYYSYEEIDHHGNTIRCGLETSKLLCKNCGGEYKIYGW